MAKMQGLAHIGLFIKDIERTKKFYTEILDFEVINECTLDDPDGLVKIAFIKNGNMMIEVVQFPVYKERGDGLFDHIALAVENIEEIRDMLAQRGIEFEDKDITHAPGVMPRGSKWILFRGPDGEHLEINEVF